MSDFADRESERLVINRQAQSRAEGIGLHFERTGIGEEILPIEPLTLKLPAELRKCFALFQGYLLQSKSGHKNSPDRSRGLYDMNTVRYSYV